MSRTNKRTSLSLRLQSTENKPLGEVISYLKSLSGDEVRREVADILIMTLLPYARYHSGKYTAEQLRSACWEAQDSLDKHGSNMRFALEVEQSKFVYPTQVMNHSQSLFNPDASSNNGSGTQKQNIPDEDKDEKDEPESSIMGESKMSLDDLNNMFGI